MLGHLFFRVARGDLLFMLEEEPSGLLLGSRRRSVLPFLLVDVVATPEDLAKDGVVGLLADGRLAARVEC